MGAITPNKSASINFKFRVGNALHYEQQMTRCDYSNSTCYKAKAIARISSIDATQGYQTGGQVLTIKGSGFGSSNITTTIDGVPCKLLSYSPRQFTCLTGPQPTPSTGTYFVGEHGLRRKFFNATYQVNLANLSMSTEFTESLALELEAPANLKDGNSGSIYSAYFKAPATAKYRFYISCDDHCQIFFSNVSMNPLQQKVIYTYYWVSGYRGYFTPDGGRMTAWMNLTKDEYYYIEVR